jgi:phosphoribosylaminoimidazole (AIR) synthetase
MYRTFNMGLAMIIVVPPSATADALAALAGAGARVVGAIVPRGGGEPSRIVGSFGGAIEGLIEGAAGAP